MRPFSRLIFIMLSFLRSKSSPFKVQSYMENFFFFSFFFLFFFFFHSGGTRSVTLSTVTKVLNVSYLKHTKVELLSRNHFPGRLVLKILLDSNQDRMKIKRVHPSKMGFRG